MQSWPGNRSDRQGRFHGSALKVVEIDFAHLRAGWVFAGQAAWSNGVSMLLPDNEPLKRIFGHFLTIYLARMPREH
jgi:hypothetical protein